MTGSFPGSSANRVRHPLQDTAGCAGQAVAKRGGAAGRHTEVEELLPQGQAGLSDTAEPPSFRQ